MATRRTPVLRGLINWVGGLFRQEGTQIAVPGATGAESPAEVSFDSAMQLSAVWACVRLLAENIASLPLQVYEVDEEGNETVMRRGGLASLFRGKINRYQNLVEFIETVVLNLVTHGNSYCIIQRNEAGQIVGLLPIMSAQVETRLAEDGAVIHYYYHSDGVTAYSAESIWHVKLFGNGIVGLSPLGYARTTIGIGIAGERRVANIFKNGGKPTGVLTIDRTLSADQRAQVRREFNELREGNSDRLMVLEAGMQYQQVSLSPQDIQLLESRRFQIEDICRFFGVPSVLVNDTSGSTTWGSGVQQLVQGFYKLNLRPYLSRIESSIETSLVPRERRGRVRVRFDFDELLRADRNERMTANQTAINSGQMTPNEGRADEGRPPVDGGDRLFVNSTLVPIDQAGKAVERPRGQE